MAKGKSAGIKEFKFAPRKVKIKDTHIQVGTTHDGFMEQATRNIAKRDDHRENDRHARADDHETAAASMMRVAVRRAVRENKWQIMDKGLIKGILDRRQAKRTGMGLREKDINQVIRGKLRDMRGQEAHDIFMGIMDELLDKGIIKKK